MKKLILFLSLLITFSTVSAAPLNKIIFFGDSLTDDGNLYQLFFHFIPKSPPYFKGRFTNGPTWAEHVGEYFYHKYYTDYKIYALGGATAIYHKFTGRFLSPTILELEIDFYLLDSLFQDKANSLFSFWIGGNDYLYDEDSDIDEGTSKVINKIDWAIRRLITSGGRNFLVFNLPDLSKIPFARKEGKKSRLKALTILNNQKLEQAVQNIRNEYPYVKIAFMNTYFTFDHLMREPEFYNKKYKAHITNTMDPCWPGGFMLTKAGSEGLLRSELQQALIAKTTPSKDWDIQAMSDFILNSPSIYHAYQINKLYEMGYKPCTNANEYVFWDNIHPTEVVHRVLALLVIESVHQMLEMN